jgi:hypothetical protein
VGSSPDRVKPKTMKLVFVVSQLTTQHYGEGKDWLARNQNNVSQWRERHQIRHTSFCSSSLLSKLSLYDGKFIQTKSWNCTNDLPADFVSLSQVV